MFSNESQPLSVWAGAVGSGRFLSKRPSPSIEHDSYTLARTHIAHAHFRAHYLLRGILRICHTAVRWTNLRRTDQHADLVGKTGALVLPGDIPQTINRHLYRALNLYHSQPHAHTPAHTHTHLTTHHTTDTHLPLYSHTTLHTTTTPTHTYMLFATALPT